MNPVDLWMCTRCRLRWVPDGEELCPRCRLQQTVPSKPVVVAGYAVPVASVFEFGMRRGLMDPDVRRGLDVLHLGDRCCHGYISTILCEVCRDAQNNMPASLTSEE